MGGESPSVDGLDLIHAELASILCWYFLSGAKGGKLRAGEDMVELELAWLWSEDLGVAFRSTLLTPLKYLLDAATKRLLFVKWTRHITKPLDGTLAFYLCRSWTKRLLESSLFLCEFAASRLCLSRKGILGRITHFMDAGFLLNFFGL